MRTAGSSSLHAIEAVWTNNAHDWGFGDMPEGYNVTWSSHAVAWSYDEAAALGLLADAADADHFEVTPRRPEPRQPPSPRSSNMASEDRRESPPLPPELHAAIVDALCGPTMKAIVRALDLDPRETVRTPPSPP